MTAYVYLLPLILVLTYSCGDDFNETDDLARLAALKTGLDLLVGEAKLLGIKRMQSAAFGAKPCGGPWEYLIFRL
ncbi:hypothetical protein E3V33_03400 [Candidatus Marinimicrobia bacterium MT.SAG.4]|nr:hypothetical protein E3V33_03400 [Candidatus Marinimicrobia bacterium MT.SAG.4]